MIISAVTDAIMAPAVLIQLYAKRGSRNRSIKSLDTGLQIQRQISISTQVVNKDYYFKQAFCEI
jgi:hypothetical protein